MGPCKVWGRTESVYENDKVTAVIWCFTRYLSCLRVYVCA